VNEVAIQVVSDAKQYINAVAKASMARETKIGIRLHAHEYGIRLLVNCTSKMRRCVTT